MITKKTIMYFKVLISEIMIIIVLSFRFIYNMSNFYNSKNLLYDVQKNLVIVKRQPRSLNLF